MYRIKEAVEEMFDCLMHDIHSGTIADIDEAVEYMKDSIENYCIYDRESWEIAHEVRGETLHELDVYVNVQFAAIGGIIQLAAIGALQQAVNEATKHWEEVERGIYEAQEDAEDEANCILDEEMEFDEEEE